jgi:TP901 family phage tail tape measure protein
MPNLSQVSTDLNVIEKSIRQIATTLGTLSRENVDKLSTIVTRLYNIGRGQYVRGSTQTLIADWQAVRAELNANAEIAIRFEQALRRIANAGLAAGRFAGGGRFVPGGGITGGGLQAPIGILPADYTQVMRRLAAQGIADPYHALRQRVPGVYPYIQGQGDVGLAGRISARRREVEAFNVTRATAEQWELERRISQEDATQVAQMQQQLNIAERLLGRTQEQVGVLRMGPGLADRGPAGPVLTDAQRQRLALLEAQREILRQPSLAAGAGIPGGAVAAEAAAERMRALNFEFGDLQRTSVEASRQITKWTFSARDANGVIRQATVVTDKFGNVLQDMGTRFRGFWSMVSRDITKVAEWAIAAGVIYGGLRKINELIRESIEIQTRLADVQIALGTTTERLGAVFDNAAVVARGFGTDVAGVIDGYLLAYRAAGQYTNETERSTVATQLLRDSMLLATLSGMDQAIALDTLTAALRQTGRELTDSADLLDKWVAVTRYANVDLRTLATTFAITGAAAEGVGADADRLNAIIGAFAEAAQTSSEETANAIRGFIAGFQSEQAQERLASFGISVRTTSGELRDFVDVMDDIASRAAQGIISEQQLSEIANIIGGGWRRGAQVMTMLQNWTRFTDIYNISVNASGEAQQALSIRLQTTQVALTNLGNAFSQLARALGSEGGFLDLITKGAQTLTKVVDAITRLVQILGRSLPVIMAFGLAWKFAGSNMVAASLANLGGFGLIPGIPIGAQFGGALMRGGGALLGGFRNLSGRIPQGYTALGGLGRIAGGAGLGALSAILSGDVGKALEGDTTSLARSGVTIATSILSTLVTGNPIIGAAIGTAISQFFIRDVGEHIGELGNILAMEFSRQLEEVPENTPQAVESQGRALLERALPGLSLTALGFFENRSRREYERIYGIAPGTATAEQAQNLQTLTMLEILAGRAPTAQGILPGLGVELLLANANDDLRRSAEELLNAAYALESAAQEQEGAFLPGTPANQALLAAGGMAGIARERLTREQQERYENFSRGLITGTEYDQFSRGIENAIVQVNTLYAALGDTASAVLGVQNAEDAYRELADLVAEYSPEQAQLLQTAANEVLRYMNAVASDASVENINALARAQEYYNQQLLGTQQAIQYQQAVVPETILMAPATAGQAQQVLARARQISEAMIEGTTGGDPILRQRMLDSIEEFAVLSGETFARVFPETIKDILPEAFNQALEEMGLDFEGGQIRWDIQTTDLPISQLPSQQMLTAMGAWLERQFPGYQAANDPMGLISTVDHQTKVYHGDSLALQLLLQDIKNLQEEQLEGVFNLPADMAALIPMTGKLYFSTSPINQGGAGLFADWANILNEPAFELKAAGTGLLAAGVALGIAATGLDLAAKAAGVGFLAAGAIGATLGVAGSFTEDRSAKRAPTIYDKTPFGTKTTTVEEFSEGLAAGIEDAILGPFMDLGGLIDSIINSLIGGGGTPLGKPSGPASILPFSEMMPDSIPITTKITLENQNIVMIDGQKILDQLMKKEQVDFRRAKRMSGTVAYEVTS